MDFEMYLTCRPCIDFQTCVRLPDTHLSCWGIRKWSHVAGTGVSGRSRCSLCLTCIISETQTRHVTTNFE